jgi:hypothetical protein
MNEFHIRVGISFSLYLIWLPAGQFVGHVGVFVGPLGRCWGHDGRFGWCIGRFWVAYRSMWDTQKPYEAGKKGATLSAVRCSNGHTQLTQKHAGETRGNLKHEIHSAIGQNTRGFCSCSKVERRCIGSALVAQRRLMQL